MFTWKPIYGEIAQRLEEFQFKNAELVEILIEMHRDGLVASPYMDRDEASAEFQLEEIDPFTFLANFNRGITVPNRQAILRFIKQKWGLNSDVPADFSGLPVVNMQKSWFMPFKFRRTAEHVSVLWKFYIHCRNVTSIDDLDPEQFDGCTALRGVGLAYLTMGMFWARPDLWISLDKKNIAYAQSLTGIGKPRNGSEYLDWLKSTHAKITVSPWEFSHEAHLRLQGGDGDDVVVGSGLAEPYSRLFDDIEHASLVLDFFARVMKELQADADDTVTVVSLTELGRSGGRIRIVYGRWAVFGYRRRANGSGFQLLLPEAHDLSMNFQPSYQFTAPGTGEKFVLGWVDEQWFLDNWQSIWNVLATALRKVHDLFHDWQASPYAASHIHDLYSLITQADTRAQALRTPLELDVDPEIAYWLLAPGEAATLWDESYERGIGTIGWDEIGDLNEYDTKEEVAEAVSELYPDAGPKSVASMMWNFVEEMKPGDVVFAKNGLFKICGWGVVSGNYRFDESRKFFKHTLPIEWKSAEEVNVPEGMQLALKTLTPMASNQAFLEAMAQRYAGVPGLSELEGPVIVEPPAVTIRYTKADALHELFMTESKLDRIVQLLKRKKNVVLQGAPGTGKTFVARRIAYLLMGEKDPQRAPMVQFHQSTAYEDFIQGYRPDGDGGFVLKNGGFHEFCERARRQSEKPFVYIIDEINRGNLSKVFGELLMLIEHDKRKPEFAVPLTYAKSLRETFYIPSNVHLIGTMNTADRSLSMVDYALRRRFSFVELEPGFESPAFGDFLQANGASTELIQTIRTRMKSLNSLIVQDTAGLGRGYRIGHSYFVPTIGHPANDEWLNEVVDSEIVPLLEEYWCDDESQLNDALRIARGI